VSAVLKFVLRHGYSILFAVLFAHQIGIPVPEPPFLLAAGALAAAGKFKIVAIVAVTIVACVLADWAWYEVGRRRGDRVLHFLHQFTRDPDFHDRRAKRIFARYGLRILLVAKFVPGLDAVTPPLAGTSRTSRVRFLAFDAMGASLYACVYGGLGYLFSNDLDRAAVYVSRMGTLLSTLAFGGLFAYVAYRLVRRYRAAREPEQIASNVPLECVDLVAMACARRAAEEDGDPGDMQEAERAEPCEACSGRLPDAAQEELQRRDTPAPQKGNEMIFAKRLVFLPAILFMVVCAHGQVIHYNYDRAADFSSYKTYQWEEVPGGNAPDQLIDQDIRRAIDEQLRHKGLAEVKQDADLVVAYIAVVHERKSAPSSSGGDPAWWEAVSAKGRTSATPVGTVTVVLYDPDRGQLVWRGDASKSLALKKDPDKNYKTLQKAMARLFDNYPPAPKK
jgi:membrane protein DedA with SNARE-associated domain